MLCRPLILNKGKVVLAAASSAYQHSMKEVLANPGIAAQIKVDGCTRSRPLSYVKLLLLHSRHDEYVQDTKALRETRVLQEFYAMLSHDSARAFYGPGHVRAAHELGAIGTLLISDSVLMVHDVAKVSSSAVGTP